MVWGFLPHSNLRKYWLTIEFSLLPSEISTLTSHLINTKTNMYWQCQQGTILWRYSWCGSLFLLIGVVVDTFVNMTWHNIHDFMVGMLCPSGGCHGYYVSYLHQNKPPWVVPISLHPWKRKMLWHRCFFFSAHDIDTITWSYPLKPSSKKS